MNLTLVLELLIESNPKTYEVNVRKWHAPRLHANLPGVRSVPRLPGVPEVRGVLGVAEGSKGRGASRIGWP